MEIATIGFTQTSAEHFFERLQRAGVRRIVDVRLHNSSQLAAFAKAADLAYFARELCGATYEHDLRLAPSEELLAAYRGRRAGWPAFEAAFIDLLRARDVPAAVDQAPYLERKTVLLCGEASAERCHRRLVAETLASAWSATVEHL